MIFLPTYLSSTGPDNEFDIEDEVIDIAPNWKGFGKALHLPPNLLERIAAQPGANPETCLSNTLAEFLKKNYEWNKYGVPSWRMIVQAVGHKIGGRDENLALRIAEKHSRLTASYNINLSEKFYSQRRTIYYEC